MADTKEVKKVNTIIPSWRGILEEGGSVLTTFDRARAREHYEALAKSLELELDERGYVIDDEQYGTTVFWFVTDLE